MLAAPPGTRWISHNHSQIGGWAKRRNAVPYGLLTYPDFRHGLRQCATHLGNARMVGPVRRGGRTRAVRCGNMIVNRGILTTYGSSESVFVRWLAEAQDDDAHSGHDAA